MIVIMLIMYCAEYRHIQVVLAPTHACFNLVRCQKNYWNSLLTISRYIT